MSFLSRKNGCGLSSQVTEIISFVAFCHMNSLLSLHTFKPFWGFFIFQLFGLWVSFCLGNLLASHITRCRKSQKKRVGEI